MLSYWGEQFLLPYHAHPSDQKKNSLSLSLAFTFSFDDDWKIGNLLDEFTNSISKILFNKWILIGLSMLCFSIQHPPVFLLSCFSLQAEMPHVVSASGFLDCMRTYTQYEYINVCHFIIIIIWQKEFYKVIIQSIIIFNIYR